MDPFDITAEEESSSPPEETTERDVDLVRQRRNALISNLALLNTIALPIGLAGDYLYGLLNGGRIDAPNEITIAVLFFALPVIAGVGLALARREQSLLASFCVLLALTIGIFGAHMASVIASQNTLSLLFFAFYSLIIVTAGAVSGQRGTFGATVITVILSGIVVANLPSDELFIYGASLLLQVVTAFVVYIVATGYAQMLDELSATRFEYERAKKLDELKAQFITSVNHELRNPVMAMLGYLELIALPRNRSAPERVDFLVQEANKAGQNLRALLNSILATRRLDQGANDFVPESVNVRESIEGAIRLIDPREASLAGRELRVRVPTNLEIWGNPVHLQQIMTNLISNAIKYSSPGAPVDITAMRVIDTEYETVRFRKRAVQVRDMIEVVVHDYGLGVPPDQIPLLFQRFVRLPRDLASKTVGNGLGLHLCRVLTEAMGGRIWVESQGIEGKGSTFHVRLAPPPAAKNGAHPQVAQGTGAHENPQLTPTLRQLPMQPDAPTPVIPSGSRVTRRRDQRPVQ
jgi:signal transduction histidine kinase